MAKTVYLHVGFHKTGTTSLQRALKKHQSDLAIQNIHYITGSSDNSHAIAWSLSRRTWGWKNQGGAKISTKVWDRAVKQIQKSRKNVLLSSEFFTEINQEQIKKIAKDLAGSEVKIIFTWRPLKKLLISSYQQYLKYGVKSDLEEWLHSVLDNPPESKITPTFWMRHLHGEVIENWAEIFGAANISLIVASESDHDFIFSAFENVISIKPGTLSNDDEFLNRALNAEEIALLLEINKSFPRNLGWDAYENSIRLGAIEKLSASKSLNPSAERLLLPNWSRKDIEKIETEQHKKMEDLGISIIGDFYGSVNDPVKYGENSKLRSVSIESAAQAIIGAGKQSLKLWRFRQLFNEVIRRLVRKIR